MTGGRMAALVLVVAAGCRRHPEPRAEPRDGGAAGPLRQYGPNAIPVEQTDVDDLPPELREAVRAQAAQQAAGLQGARVELRRAYAYGARASFAPAAGARLVAVDVSIGLSGAGAFDPDDVELVDADSDESFGSDPEIHRLTDSGQAAEWEDPVFTDPDRFRMLLVYSAPRATRRVALSYWGSKIGAAATIEPSGPTIPLESHVVLSHAAAGPAPLEGYLRHRVLLEARNWSRMTRPDWFTLAYSLAGKEKFADSDHWIEVDDRMRPISDPIERRPLMLPVRRFVIEFWLIEGGKLIAFNELGRRTPLPAQPLMLTPVAEKALARAQPNLDATHYHPEIEGQ